MLAMHIAHCISRGSHLLGFNTTPSNVLRLQVELPQYKDRERNEKYCIASKSIYIAKHRKYVPVTELDLANLDATATTYAYPPTVINRTEQFIHIDESSGWESLKQDIENCVTYLPAAPLVVILDPLYKMFNRDLNNEVDVKPLLDKMDILMDSVSSISGISFIIIHHTRKALTTDKGLPVNLGSQDATGSRALVRWCDTNLRIDPVPNDNTLTRMKLTFTKYRNAEDTLPTITLKWNRTTLHPQIISRTIPVDDNDEEEIELRGDSLMEELE
tara:strand:+ start:23802 stop:24620 length:819 start_codon:yes stop_codon:yes gene_type:complete